MNSRLTTPHGRQILSRLSASGLRLESTSRRIGYWVEGLLACLGLDGVERLMKLLVAQARAHSNPSAWFNWASLKPWTGLMDDTQIRFVHNGPPEPPRRADDCGPRDIRSLILARFA